MSLSQPKYLQISQAIEAKILNATWQNGKIPSVREIAAAHNVSVVTASRALQVLRDKGIINAVERSGCFLVNREATGKEHWAVVTNVTPGPWKKATEAILWNGFEGIARQQSIKLETDLIDFSEKVTDRDLVRLLREARERGVGGIFFLPSRLSDEAMHQDEQFLHGCEMAGLPVILIERNLRGADRPLRYDLVCSDDVDGGRQSARHLLELGRRRIVFVAGSPTSSHLDRLAGYCQVLSEAHAQGRADPPCVFWQDPDLTSKHAYSTLARQLLAHGADGVICYQDYTAIGLMLDLFAQGVAVPKQIAITGFDDLPIGTMFSIGVTTYAFPSQEVARQAIWLMRDRIQQPRSGPIKLVVSGQLIPRESSVSQSELRNGE